MKEWSFFIRTFGCKVNQYESQAVREAWVALGGVELPSPDGADVTMINSCAVTGKAERDARGAILAMKREAPSALRLITGCSARLAGNSFIERKGQAVHMVIENANKHLLLYDPRSLTAPFPQHNGYPPLRINDFQRSRPILKVQDGCSRRCTYCIVPLMRGQGISRRPEEAVDEAKRLFKAGFHELIISGINLAQYGRDFNPALDFWDLAEMLNNSLASEWAGRARLRISSLDPNQLNEKAVRVLSAGQLFCPHLHLSLQSGSPEILRRMGRGDQHLDNMLESLFELRRHWPVLGLGADILTGFPGETDADVAATAEIMQRAGLHYAHVFPFAPRPGTPAADFSDQIPLEEKKLRAAKLRELAAVQGLAFTASLQGRMLHAIADGHGSDKAVNEFYAPCRFSSTPTWDDTRKIVETRAVSVRKGVLILEKL